jgi:hypothetical protein
MLLLTSAATLLAQSSAPAAAYRISGKVVNADSGAPLAGADISILTVVNGEAQDPGNEDAPRNIRRNRRSRGGPTRTALDSVTSAADGSFAFDHVPAGKYSLQGSHRGFLSASYQEHGFYSTAIVTGPGLPSEGLTLKLSPGAVISGSVIDTAGDPIEQASVTLYRLSDDGLGNIRMYRATNADDLGAYEFAHLPPGTYFVSATAHVWYARGASNFTFMPDGASLPAAASNLDVAYPRAYYADASDSDAATPIPARGGDHLRIDLHMQAVPAVHLTYTQPPNDGHTRAFARPLSLTQSVFGNRDSVSSEAIAMGGSINGNQSMSTTLSVAPGEYEAEIGGRTLSINAGGDAIVDPQSGTPPTEVSGRIGAAPGATLPESVDMTLDPAGSRQGGTLSAIAHDGVFHFDQVPPGTYEVGAQAEGRPIAIVQAAESGGQLNGRVLQVATQPVTFAATVAPETAILSGFARAATQPGTQPSAEPDQTASGAMIVLVPQHQGDHALYRRDQADSDGSFSLRQVAPGTYTLVAIADGWDLEWARPEVIAHYLPGGQPVTITPTSPAVTHLPKPVVVQPR